MSNVEQAVFDALNEMYSKAEPPADFDHIKANPDEYPDDWYDQHYLPEVEQNNIVKKYSEEYDLSDKEHTQLVMNAILNWGPKSIKKEDIEDE